MNSKLTLILNKKIIDDAKTYAEKNQISLSKLIEIYLDSLVKSSKKKSKKISPLVESLTGVISLESVERKTSRNHISTRR